MSAPLAFREQRWALLLLFLLLLGIYSATSGGHTSSIDEEEMVDLTAQLAQHGFSAYAEDRRAALMAIWGPEAIDWVPSHRPLTSLLALPLYVAGTGISHLFEPRYEGFIARAALTLLSALATAGCGVLLASMALLMGLDSRRALILALLFGLTTLAWPYAKYFRSEPVATLFLLLTVLCAIRARQTDSVSSWLVSGLCLLAATAARLNMIVGLPAFVLYIVISRVRGSNDAGCWRSGGRDAAAFVLPAVVAGVALLAYTVRTPSSDTFYLWPYILAVFRQMSASNLAQGLYGLLLSPGKSVFLYSPVLVVGLAALPAFFRWRLPEAVLCVVLVATQTLLAAAQPAWHGDPAWGPRYLVPVIPFMLLPVAAWLRFEGWHAHADKWRRSLLLTMAALGVAVQLPGVLVNFDTYVDETGGALGQRAAHRWFTPAESPLVASVEQLASRISAPFVVVPPVPVTDQERWSEAAFRWFYAPDVPHLVDLWPWYVAQSGLPPALALVELVPLALACGAGAQLIRLRTSVSWPEAAPSCREDRKQAPLAVSLEARQHPHPPS